MGNKSRVHKSRFKGASRHGKNEQQPKKHGRYLRYEGGAVVHVDRTPEEQLERLDRMGLTAKKERAKLKKRMEKNAEKAKNSTTDKASSEKPKKRTKKGS